MAATDNNFAPWFSPAGTRRGQYFGVTSLEHSPNKSERDQLYQAGINPISNIPGQGILLYGDKTHLARPSAFDRINVRRLFLVLERAIGRAAEQVLFEFNDDSPLRKVLYFCEDLTHCDAAFSIRTNASLKHAPPPKSLTPSEIRALDTIPLAT